MDVPPYHLQTLIKNVSSTGNVQIRCAQALGTEIYVGCSNGELLRFALQAAGSNSPEHYTLLSRQSLPSDKPIDEIVIIASLARVLVLSDRQIHLYTLPALDPLSAQIKPIRHIEGLAVDEMQLRRFASGGHSARGVEPVDFCAIKRSSIVLYTLRDKLTYRTEIPFPGAICAKRAGLHLCVADKEMYHIVDLNAVSTFPLLPIVQSNDAKQVKPSITVINENEFLLLSWTGQATMGVFITGDGDPVRGTLEWNDYPESITLDYPFVTAVLPNQTVEIHNIETQVLVQTIPAPSHPISSTADAVPTERMKLTWSAGGFMVPSSQLASKLKKVPVGLVRKKKEVVVQGEKTGDVTEDIPVVEV
ncbi:CNH domain-containing protein [Cristinia sonorae]|uniref:CNH domain-containing protein n=1 Tax=Cristinia sonorae TaxID=1940300 RepID=A0A8K0XJK6_9AGAR|nr:CNH domain-containing protein [Cristinia sonorae]